MVKQEVWSLDIETKPYLAYVWDRRDVNIALNQLKEDQSILAWSAKKLYAPAKDLIYYDLRNAKDYSDDRSILKPLWNILDKADILITQNGKSFDSKKINARLIQQGFKKPSDYRHFDTWLLASRVASFTSTKLEYLTDKLNLVYKKQDHSEFPGMSLWTECLKGNKKAWDAMKHYNIHDTLSTEELALQLKEWSPPAFPDWNDEKCSSCQKVKKIKVKCQECGSWGQK